MIHLPLFGKTLRMLIGVAVAFACTQAAGAGNGVRSPAGVVSGQLEVLEDPSAGATLPQVIDRREDFHALSARTPNFNFSPSAYWFRLPVENSRERAVRLFLDIKHPTLDDVGLYVRHSNGRFDYVHTGDRIAAGARPVHATTLVLPFTLAAGETAELFLRVSADAGALIVPFELVERAGLQHSMLARRLLHGTLLGLFLALFVYNLLLYLALPDRSHLYYVIYLPFALLTITALDGFGPSVLYPRWTWPGNEGLIVFSGITFFLILSFARGFLNTREHRDLDRWVRGLLAASLMLAAAPLLLPIRAAYELDMLMVFAFPLVSAGVGVISWRRGRREARFFVFGQVASCIGLMAFGLLIYGVLPFNLFLFESISLGIAADALLLALALADRIRLLQDAKLAAENTVRKNLELRQEELERVVAERTAELEVARNKAEHLALTDPLTGIANRRGLLELAEREIKLAIRHRRPLAVVMLDLDHFKRVNDTYGHAEGDRVLGSIVSAAQKEIRDTDLFGRVGGEEFLLILPDTTADAAVAVAERVRMRIAEEVTVGVPPEPVTASLGVAWLTATTRDLEALESAADAALYTAKRNGRNRVATHRAAA